MPQKGKGTGVQISGVPCWAARYAVLVAELGRVRFLDKFPKSHDFGYTENGKY